MSAQEVEAETEEPKETKEVFFSLLYMDWALASVPSGYDRNLRVLLTLVRHANKKGKCWPGRTTIAEMAFGLDREQVTNDHKERVRRSMVWLRDQGLVTYGYNPIRKATVYTLLTSAEDLSQQRPRRESGPRLDDGAGDRHGNGVGDCREDGVGDCREDGSKEPEKSQIEEPSGRTTTTAAVVATQPVDNSVSNGSEGVAAALDDRRPEQGSTCAGQKSVAPDPVAVLDRYQRNRKASAYCDRCAKYIDVGDGYAGPLKSSAGWFIWFHHPCHPDVWSEPEPIDMSFGACERRRAIAEHAAEVRLAANKPAIETTTLGPETVENENPFAVLLERNRTLREQEDTGWAFRDYDLAPVG